jgi:hypothetical protein
MSPGLPSRASDHGHHPGPKCPPIPTRVFNFGNKKFRNPLRNGKFPKFPKFQLKFKLNSKFLKIFDMISVEIAAPATFLDGVE